MTAAASLQQRDAPHQLWLDVARPVQPRPRRARAGTATEQTPSPAVQDQPAPQNQFELRMVPAADAPPARTAFQVKTMPDAPVPRGPGQARSFATWLINQGKQSGSLGELARAVKLDRLFPKTGSADDVRARFSAAGADGDAFAALDDAEREFDRLG
jgi:hypothetical protein